MTDELLTLQYDKVDDYYVSDGRQVPIFNDESALIEMLAEGILFMSSGWNAELGKYLDICELMVNCNDLFYWACADAQSLPNSQVEALYRMWKEDPDTGVEKWCCYQRGLRPQAPIERDWRAAGWWNQTLEALSKPESS